MSERKQRREALESRIQLKIQIENGGTYAAEEEARFRLTREGRRTALLGFALFAVFACSVLFTVNVLSPEFSLATASRGVMRRVNDVVDLISGNHLQSGIHFFLCQFACAMLAGVALAASGACFQAVFHNPMASPTMLGVQSGGNPLIVAEIQSLQNASFQPVLEPLLLLCFSIPVLVPLAVMLLMRSRMNLIAFGEEEARLMGVNVGFDRTVLVLLSTVMTAAVVAFCGAVSFVGLIVPHFARTRVGSDFKYMLPACSLPPARRGKIRAPARRITQIKEVVTMEENTGKLTPEEIQRASRAIGAIIANVETVIIGKRESVELVLATLLARGHVLLEDVPGVGKTSLISAVAKSVDCGFKRIQFTPDLMPSDITGFSVYNQKSGEFEFRPGAVMSNLILADEINRSSAKTQASLLEAMEEKQVTVDSKTYTLEDPFMVMATQNPLESYDVHIVLLTLSRARSSVLSPTTQ